MSTLSKRIALLSLVLAAVLAVAYRVRSNVARANAPEAVSLRTVRVTKVEAPPASVSQWYYGTTRSTQRAVLSFAVPGRMVERFVQVGAHVSADELLARVDPRGYANALVQQRATLASLDSRLAHSEREDGRMQRLAATASIATSVADQVATEATSLRVSRAAANAQVADARRTYSETMLRAPFSGWISSVLVEPGEFAAVGRPVLTLEGDGATEIELEVTEGTVGALRVGGAVRVDLPLSNVTDLAGTIVSIGGAAPERDRLFPVVIRVADDPRLRHGMAARIRLDVAVRADVAVPLRSVISPTGERAHVFRVRSGRVQAVPVTVGMIVGDRISVRGDLAVGDDIVVAGHVSLLHGDRVEVIR